MGRPVFEEYPIPWSSHVVHDAEGNPISDHGWVRQYFVAADGRPVRDSDGNFVHVKIENRKPLVDADGNPVLEVVEILPEHRDDQGRPILQGLPGAEPDRAAEGALPLNAMTPRSRRGLVDAAAIAQAHRQGFIGTEHILLALARDSAGVAGQLLEQLGVRQKLEERLTEIIAGYPPGSKAPDPGDEVRVRFQPDPRSNHPLRRLD